MDETSSNMKIFHEHVHSLLNTETISKVEEQCTIALGDDIKIDKKLFQ